MTTSTSIAAAADTPPPCSLSADDGNKGEGDNTYSQASEANINMSTEIMTWSSISLRNRPPPLRFIEMNPNERYPPPPPPPPPPSVGVRKNDKAGSSYSSDAEELVRCAIACRHELASSILHSSSSASSKAEEGGDKATDNAAATKAKAADIIHKTKLTDAATHLTDLLMRRIHNAHLLHAALSILPVCDTGKALDKLASYPKLHARTIHLLMILDPFIPDGIGSSNSSSSASSSSSSGNSSGSGSGGGVGVEELRRIDIARRERRKNNSNDRRNNMNTHNKGSNNNNNNNNNAIVTPKAAQIAEPSIRHKEDTQYILPNVPYFNYSIADAHFRLLISLVSCNSTYGPPVVRTLWTLLTDFGGRWKEYMVAYDKLGHEDKVKLLERDRPVPGMAGLSVEFIRDAFLLCNGDSSADTNKEDSVSNVIMTEMTTTNTDTNAYKYDDDNHEEKYSDRLPHGRVHRLLLAINNIFRICPQSKNDLLREISSNFPHYKFCPRSRYIWYIHICMQLVHLATASYEGPVLALFVDRALDMDVEIKINDAGAVALSNTTTSSSAATTDDGDVNYINDLVTTADSRKRSYEQMTDTNNVPIPSSNDGITSSSSTTAAMTTISTAAVVEEGKAVDEDLLEISERLDTLMSTIYGRIILITTYQSNSLTSAMAAVVCARKLYRSHLEGVFERKVRTTDRTKFVQFIFLVLFGRENDALVEVGRLLTMREKEQQLLHHQDKMYETIEDSELVCVTTMPYSSDEPLYRGFIAKLIDYFYNPNYAGDAPRRTVVCYLASFVSRATYVCPETVCECLAALLRWAEVYIAAQSSEAVVSKNLYRLSSSSTSSRLSLGGGNTQHSCELHALFYTCCQAAFYIFCFRGAEALTYYHRACQHRDDSEAGYADPQSVDIGPERWKFLCGHSLQPLKYCLESVRSEFLTLAQELNLFHNDADEDDNGGGISRKDDATKFVEQLRTNISSSSSSSLYQKQSKQIISSPISKKLKLSATPKSRRSTIISTAATQEKKRLDGGVGGLGRGSNPLDSFFPFDPYLLKHSHEYVCPYFRNWQDCILTFEEEEDLIDSNCFDIPVEESVVDDEDSNSEAESDDDNYDDERIDDVESGISDIEDEDEEIVAVDEKEISDDDDDEEEIDEQRRESNMSNDTLRNSLSSDNHLEMEIRRSRAMSTGSQCSW